MKHTSDRWSDKDEKLCRQLLDSGKTSAEVGAIIGRTAKAVRNKMCSPKSLKVHSVVSMHVPREILAERDRRVGLQHRDLTAAFFGDPLPGFSALERQANA